MIRLIERHASPGVPFLAIAQIVYGIYLLWSPEAFRGVVFDPAKSIAPLWAWGVVMVTAGAVGFTWRNRWASSIVPGIGLLWGFLLWQGAHKPFAGGPAGWVPWVFPSVATFFGLYRRGTRG